MARKPSTTLTPAELRLMEVLWTRRHATVAEVTAELGHLNLAYSTVLTTMRILENKGYVRHTEQGRAFVYRPLVERDQASRDAVRQLAERFFNGSPGLLALNALENEKIDGEELTRLKKLIRDAEGEPPKA